MKNEVLKSEETAILNNCKVVDKVNVVDLLSLAKTNAKRGRKSFEEMTEDEHYEEYLRKCERQGHPALSKNMWSWFNLLYDWEELLTTEDIEANDPRTWKESKASKLGYIGDELDYEAIDSLYKVIFKALQKRLVIILNLESVPSLINTAYKCRYGGCDCKNVNAALNAKLSDIRKLLNDKEVSEWLKAGNTDMLFYGDPNGVNSYIETYQKVIRQLTDIRGESLEYVRPIIHNELDIFEDEIISNDIPDCESYFESGDSDDLDDIFEENLD